MMLVVVALAQECESLWEYSSRHPSPAATNLWRVSSWELSPTVKLILITLLAVQSHRILNQILDAAVRNEWTIKVEIRIPIIFTFTKVSRLFIVMVGRSDSSHVNNCKCIKYRWYNTQIIKCNRMDRLTRCIVFNLTQYVHNKLNMVVKNCLYLCISMKINF